MQRNGRVNVQVIDEQGAQGDRQGQVMTAAYPNTGTLEIWREVAPSDKLLSISVEELLDTIIQKGSTIDPAWVDYLKRRCRF